MTNLRVDSEPAFVLHARPYRETSQLVDLFSRHYGRLRVVARGFRRPKNGSRILAPFTPLLVGWSGKTELKTLVSAEHSGRSLMLSGERLYSGFYLNELLIRLLVEHDPHQHLFDHYLNIMTSLADGEPIEPALRQFERNLLDEAGYGLMIDTDIVSGQPVLPGQWYWFEPSTGFSLWQPSEQDKNSPYLFRGEALLAISHGDYQDLDTARAAKRLMRLAIHEHLGDKPLRSRELFNLQKNDEVKTS
jgi:DNA repair protein RecO (recombination protein O)